jgi:putative MATE family efflux protein
MTTFDLGSGRALDKRIAALAIPSLGALAAEPLYVLADTAIVGHISTNALASLAVAGSILTTVTWLFGFLSMVTTTNLAQAVGADDPAQAKRTFAHAAAIAAVLGVALGIVIAASAPLLVRAMGASDDSRRGAITYLQISAIGLPLQLWAYVGHSWWRAHENVRRSFVIVLIANATNLLLELLFVYVFGWGLVGSAIGTVIAQLIAGVLLVTGIAGRGGWRPVFAALQRSEIVAILKPAVSIVIRTGGHVSVLILATATVARLGTVPLAAHQLALQLFSLFALILDALAVPAQVLSGQAIGAGQPRMARTMVNRTMVIAGFVGLAIAVILIVSRTVLARPFTADSAVRAAIPTIFVLLAVQLLLGAFAFTLDGALFGVSDYVGLRKITLMAAASFWPVPFIIRGFDLGLRSVWIGLVWWMLVRTALIYRRWGQLTGELSANRSVLDGQKC